MILTRDLGGHSGCRILLCEDKNNVFVRKISKSLEYNGRLKTQKEKQSDFLSEIIRTPLVMDEGYTEDGMYYFDMEYVQGITLSEYIKSIRISDIGGIVETLILELSLNRHLSDMSKLEVNDVFRNKINSLGASLNRRNKTIDIAVDLLQNHDWSAFEHTSCHGDLTLENIIVNNGQLYLIDFLDSFYDSWILDVSTLLQDVQSLWSYRYDSNLEVNAALRLMLFRDILMDNMKKQHQDIYYEAYYALLLKLIRIFPYTNDADTYNFLIEKTKSLINIIDRGGWK